MQAFPARKIASAAAVILLHVAIVVALVRATMFAVQPHAQPREQISWLIFAPKPAPAKKSVEQAKSKEHAIFSPKIYPDYRSITLPPITGETNLNGIHGSLFDCDPTNLINLTPEERAQCTTASIGPKPGEPDDNPNFPTRSKNGVRWARGLMRKQQPLLLPCMPPLSLAAIICAAKGISDGGFDLDMQPSYGDKPQNIHVPNNGDPPDGPPK